MFVPLGQKILLIYLIGVMATVATEGIVKAVAVTVCKMLERMRMEQQCGTVTVREGEGQKVNYRRAAERDGDEDRAHQHGYREGGG